MNFVPYHVKLEHILRVLKNLSWRSRSCMGL